MPVKPAIPVNNATSVDSWAIVTADGCQECPGCSKILKDYMDELSAGIGKTIRLKESGGRVTEDIEQLVFMKNTAILLKVCI